ncbi:MAG: D-alanyl-D-alanine carboxypeptidase/D-alanyl-D-alanine-endopeptidase [Calditrichaceae bacterium]|nr:D-alanyl-D-alanine carboxypeptidase/D-alanyl-D-alanine-endopeptidase [Calditrichaceae bacterium]RQV96276.1 MAG: D-alanyl-D-alanine carboxypeptidase/D-alanyl-D-alanine-endopeptidase [Calditrichota bacterium]
MTAMIKIIIPTVIIFLSALVLDAQPLQKLAESISRTEPLLQAQWSVYAEYIESGQMLVDLNSNKNLVPASGLKLITSAAALDYLGEDYQYETKLIYTGFVQKDLLNGDIIIRGSGDPTLGSNQIKGALPLDSLMMYWVKAVQDLGIKKISGAVIADPYIFDAQSIPDFWNWRDMGNYYAAGTSGLCIHENFYNLRLKPGLWIGAPVMVLGTDPEIPDMSFSNELKTAARGSGDNAYLYYAPGQYFASLRGTIPQSYKEFKIKGAIPDPALFTAQVLKKELQKAGIPVTNESRIGSGSEALSDAVNITKVKSPALKDIIYILNKRSVNLYAEQLVKTIAVHEGLPGSYENGLTLILKFLERNDISPKDIYLTDGSGLSRTNTITTKVMVQVLKIMFKHPAFKSYYNSLVIAGDPDDIGFFSSYGQNSALAGNARIKSGLIPRIRSHSGYLQNRKGQWIAFSIMANNYNGSLGQINHQHLIILKALADLQ